MFSFLGLSVGVLTHASSSAERVAQLQKDVTYTTGGWLGGPPGHVSSRCPPNPTSLTHHAVLLPLPPACLPQPTTSPSPTSPTTAPSTRTTW